MNTHILVEKPVYRICDTLNNIKRLEKKQL